MSWGLLKTLYDNRTFLIASFAVVAELADAQDLGSCTVRCVGSSPSDRTFSQWKSTVPSAALSGKGSSLFDKGKMRFYPCSLLSLKWLTRMAPISTLLKLISIGTRIRPPRNRKSHLTSECSIVVMLCLAKAATRVRFPPLAFFMKKSSQTVFIR